MGNGSHVSLFVNFEFYLKKNNMGKVFFFKKNLLNYSILKAETFNQILWRNKLSKELISHSNLAILSIKEKTEKFENTKFYVLCI